MKIKRNILGTEVEIELTAQEMYDVFTEEQRLFDISDIKMTFEGLDAAEIAESYDTQWSEIEPLIPEMARRYRKYMNDYSDDWVYQRDEAIADVLNEHRKEREYETI